MIFEPWMPSTAPGEILLHDAVHDGGVAFRETKVDRERDIDSSVQDGGIIPEPHRRVVERLSLTISGEQLARLHHFGDEHGPFALGSRAKKVQVLPHGTADRARNPHIMFESGPSTFHRLWNQLGDHHSTFGTDVPIIP